MSKRANVKSKRAKKESQNPSNPKKIGNQIAALVIMSLVIGWGSMLYQLPADVSVFLPGPRTVERGWPLAFLRCTTDVVVCETNYPRLFQNILIWFGILLVFWGLILITRRALYSR